jgi:hypothetical protein
LPSGARREEFDLEALTFQKAAASPPLSDGIAGASSSGHFAGAGNAMSRSEYELVAALSIASIILG